MDKYADLRRQLIAIRGDLLKRVASIKAGGEEPLSQDFAEQAVEREEEEVLDALGHAAHVELNEIRHALDRMDNGTYDECSTCGMQIPIKRLESLPYTDTCVDCAQAQETRDKRPQ